MDAITVIRAQLKQARDMLDFAMNDLSAEQLHHRGEGWTIQSIATIYAHVVTSEDALMNRLVREQPMLHERENWQEKVGIPHESNLDALAELVTSADMDALRVYAQSVYAETDAYIATLSETDLDRVISFGPMGDLPLGVFLGTVIVWHFNQHSGEISALKGTLGGQGLPF